ncbi:MAG: hypothetical protein HQL77_13840 [Magnetococcales bacterium]|nr:hypothetical protein [Magnetococcales bacterium]MBF0436442.1 hypothetical protein [Magnetococcales bacterium]
MWCKYTYKASATKANIMNDVVLLLTGTSSLASLSADCDQANSVLVTTVAAGWTLHDASAGTNAKCVKAALADDAATFKYLVVDTNTTGYIFFKIYETWNASTHTGTNLTYGSDLAQYAQRISTSSFQLYLSASARHAIGFSDIGAGTSNKGCSTGNRFTGVMERTRQMAWDTVAAGYPPYAFIMDSTNLYAPRIKVKGSSDITGSSASGYYGCAYTTAVLNFSYTGTVTDSSGGEYAPLIPLLMHRLGMTGGFTDMFGNFSSQCDIWLIPASIFSLYDEFTANSKTYVAIIDGGPVKIAIRKA